MNWDGVRDYLVNLSDLSQLSLGQIISGTRTVLNKVEAGLKSDLLEELPLIGDIADFGGTFIGDLNFMIDELDSLISSSNSAITALTSEVQQTIYQALGPAGADILDLDPLFHNDEDVDDAEETSDFRDVEVFLSDPLTTPAEELQFFINIGLAGRDTIDVDFDLGLDAFVFDINTNGGVELNWDYNFDFGIGVSLQEGFFFQLNEDVTYVNGTPATGTPEFGLSADVSLKPGTSLNGELFFLNLSAESNAIEDYNRDGIINDGSSAT